MCLICIDLVKNKLTPDEARGNLREMLADMPVDHFIEVLDLIAEKEEDE